ncbi:FAST kinase domain-containing protein 5, mitochondrial isoform X3 [Plodia interpunctella]|uniref:FAST kinase domain-containing protein 5, mitochondrial isoform X2 n=1 Tax=Plodia interpunctella TaxID=58824 RepID=UPI00236751E4|nr:FAST kinase domain-containing protein 5, mitochondrial isoform X2 [Plodia interpunctella]XP_053600236.1 FAST kinase domain-containing protein 5, mitochondrial isoform X3 [Plodia interpunctella]
MGFHCDPKLCIKMYLEHENQYAYSIMERYGYAQRLSLDNEISSLTSSQFDNIMMDWSRKKPSDLIDFFSKLGVYCKKKNLCISNQTFDTFIDNLTDSIKNTSDQELESLFYAVTNWPETESIRTRNYIEVWAALDDECINRLQKWSFDEVLKYVSLFFMLNVTRVSEFSQKGVQKLVTKAKQLSHSQVVQTMFYTGILRRSPFDMHNMELELVKRFKEFTLDELAIISMGFFKSKTPIRDSKLVFQIINKIIENSNDVNEISLASLLKIIRYSLRKSKDSEIYKLLDTLQHEVPRLSVMCNVHLALVGTSTLTLHEECLHKIAETVGNHIAETRLKDLERLVFTFGIFNIKPVTKECFFDKVLNELRRPERRSEIEKHGRAYACCISYLSLLEIYPVDLMSDVLSKKFLDKAYGNHHLAYGREILTIHTTASIFCPEAKMNRLTDKCAISLAKKYTEYVPSENFVKNYNDSHKLFLDVMKVLKEERGGDEYVIGDHVLPHHHKGDIIICNDQKGSPVKIPESYKHTVFGLVRKIPDNKQWIVFIIPGKNGFILNSDVPTGTYQTKIRELKALGYNVALVNWTSYGSLETKEEKLKFINNLVREAR